MMLQHGDVLLLRVEELPVGAIPVEAIRGKFVLAEGELTGHAHTIIADERVRMFRDPESQNLYLEVFATTQLDHQQHGVEELPIGILEVAGVVEVDPFKDVVRKMRD